MHGTTSGTRLVGRLALLTEGVIGLAVLLLAATARANKEEAPPGLRFAWRAPSGCPTRDIVLLRILAEVGRQQLPGADAVFRARAKVLREKRGFRLAVEWRARGEPAKRRWVLAESCEQAMLACVNLLVPSLEVPNEPSWAAAAWAQDAARKEEPRQHGEATEEKSATPPEDATQNRGQGDAKQPSKTAEDDDANAGEPEDTAAMPPPPRGVLVGAGFGLWWLREIAPQSATLSLHAAYAHRLGRAELGGIALWGLTELSSEALQGTFLSARIMGVALRPSACLNTVSWLDVCGAIALGWRYGRSASDASAATTTLRWGGSPWFAPGLGLALRGSGVPATSLRVEFGYETASVFKFVSQSAGPSPKEFPITYAETFFLHLGITADVVLR